MSLYRFPRDRIFLQRIVEFGMTPCEIKAFDYPIGGCPSAVNARDCITELIDRFDAFRTQLHLDANVGLFARLSDAAAPHIQIEEVSSLESDVPPADRFKDTHSAGVDLIHGPPSAFYFYRSPGQRRSLLRVLCSHFATDFVTHRLVAQAIQSLFENSGAATQLAAGSYLEWMEVCYAYSQSEQGSQEFRFWRAYPTEPFEQVRGMLPPARNGAALSFNLRIPMNVIGALRGVAQNRWQCRLVDGLAGAILLAVGRELEIEAVPVNWTSHGRYPINGHRFTSTGGWLSDRHPVLVPVLGAGVVEVTQALRDSIHQLPNWGSTYPWVARFADAADGADVTHPLHAPITVNLRERSIPPPVPLARRSKGFPPITKAALPQWHSASALYVVVDVGMTTNISVTCVDANGFGERVETLLASVASQLSMEAQNSIH